MKKLPERPEACAPGCRGWVHADGGGIEACDDCGPKTADGASDDAAAKVLHAAECGCSWDGTGDPVEGPFPCAACGQLIPTDDPAAQFCCDECEAAWNEENAKRCQYEQRQRRVRP